MDRILNKITLEKILCLLVAGLILGFFLAEMLMKPLSGEDVFQQQCMEFSGGWAAAGHCARTTLNSIPRIGQIAHYLVIWKFQIIPHLGLETIIRVIDALMSFGIVYVIATLALGKRYLNLRYKDGVTLAIAFVFLMLSSAFASIFFNGFSNVHNYVPAVFFTLVFVYVCLWRNEISKRIGNIWMAILWFVISFLFAASTELNSLVVFTIALCYAVYILIRSKDKFELIKSWRKYAAPILGVIAGFIFLYVLGDGFGSTVGRANSGYLQGLSLSGLIGDPLRQLPILVSNAVSNFVSYLPYIILAFSGMAMIPKQSRAKYRTARRLFSLAIAFSVIYIGFCSLVDGVMWRLTAIPFCLLLVPTTYLIVRLVLSLPTKRTASWATVLAVGFIAIMCLDNLLFLNTVSQETRQAISTIERIGCIDDRLLKELHIGTESTIFRFSHPETALTHVASEWYGNIYLINGRVISISDTCSNGS